MWNKAKDAELKAIKMNHFLKKGFELFSSRSIESVTLSEVAKAAGYGMATLYRYFDKKPGFVIAVATWKWSNFQDENSARVKNTFDNMSAYQAFDFYLDSFLELYRKHRDLLRFNQFFNIFIKSENIDPKTLEPYNVMIERFHSRFHDIYSKGIKDHTLKTDVPEKEMFETTLHLMLAAITRYAVGLVYKAENESISLKELTTLKEAFMLMYKGESATVSLV
ncbi:MAG: TetR/AcrR family transcriptional regulator [Lachnospiraceae bacterium]|nr:TetR/AcrR family transcriptional regulator [Lachnospiraceae bacterium]